MTILDRAICWCVINLVTENVKTDVPLASGVV
jgi:hypothetical protein